MSKFTDKQRQELRDFEHQLIKCAKIADLDRAKIIVRKIAKIFGDDKTHHRLLRSLNWYAECAMEAHRSDVAILVLNAVCNAANTSTRIYIEAIGIRTIASFRLKEYAQAKEGARYVIQYLNRITSDAKRRQFQKRFIDRIEDECILAGLSGISDEQLNPERIHESAAEMVQKKSEHEIFALIEKQMPGEAVLLVKDVKDFAILQLSESDKRFLLSSSSCDGHAHLGKKCATALKRIAWKTFCNPDSEIYKLWSKKLPSVYGSGYFAAALTAAFKEWKIGFPLIAAGVVAIAIKYGCEEFCVNFTPASLMIPVSEKPTKSTE